MPRTKCGLSLSISWSDDSAASATTSSVVASGTITSSYRNGSTGAVS